MITVHLMAKPTGGGQPFYYEFEGESTDTKPSIWGGHDVGLNSKFFEQDTGDFYYLKQQGSSTTTTGEIVEEQTLDSWTLDGDFGCYKHDFYYEIGKDKIIVEWDGVSYECEKQIDNDSFSPYVYYGTLLHQPLDWSVYPFCIIPDENHIYCADNEDHTIKISWEETVVTEPIWAIVGGGDSPVEEGYDVNCPKLTISFSNVENNFTFYLLNVNESGYLQEDAVDEFTSTTVLETYCPMTHGSCQFIGFDSKYVQATSNEVNCEYDDGIIFITDPTQDASITMAIGGK